MDSAQKRKRKAFRHGHITSAVHALTLGHLDCRWSLMPSNVTLVPPSLKVIALLLTSKRIHLPSSVELLCDSIKNSRSFPELQSAGYPLIKVAHNYIGHGLGACMTQALKCTTPGGCPRLLWLHEIRCHSYCGILSSENCFAHMPAQDVLEKIKKKHIDMLDRIPTA